MAKETHEWNENSDHIVLFMDIMGFKDRVMRMGHKELLEKMIEFKEKNDRLVMCKKLVASVDRFDKVVPLTEFLGEDNLSGKPLLVRFVNRSLDVISF